MAAFQVCCFNIVFYVCRFGTSSSGVVRMSAYALLYRAGALGFRVKYGSFHARRQSKSFPTHCYRCCRMGSSVLESMQTNCVLEIGFSEYFLGVVVVVLAVGVCMFRVWFQAFCLQGLSNGSISPHRGLKRWRAVI